MCNSDVYTMVLLPPADLSFRLEALSQELAAHVNSLITLDSTFLPHITIMQWAHADADLLRQQLAVFSQMKPGEVLFDGFTAVPGCDGDKWIEISVVRTGWLSALQSDAAKCAEGNGVIINNVDDNYRPHMTLGLTYDKNISLSWMETNLSRITSENWTINFGKSGKNYTFSQIIPLI